MPYVIISLLVIIMLSSWTLMFGTLTFKLIYFDCYKCVLGLGLYPYRQWQ